MIELSKIDATKRVGGLLSEDYALVESLPLFRGLGEEVIISLISDGHIKVVDRSTVLFVKGEHADRFYLILDGWVKLTRQSFDGNESIIGVYTRGETFAEAAMFSQDGFPVNAICVGKCRLLMIPASSVFRTFKENSDYAINVVASLSRHMRGLVRQIEQLSVRSSTERLASFLLSLCPKEEEAFVVSLPIEKSLVAGRLGMQPETLSRSLAKLREVGVETHGSRVHISNIRALEGLCPDQ